MTITEWLNKPLHPRSPTTAIERLCEISTDGVAADRMLELARLAGILEGFSILTDGASDAVVDAAIGAELERREATVTP